MSTLLCQGAFSSQFAKVLASVQKEINGNAAGQCKIDKDQHFYHGRNLSSGDPRNCKNVAEQKRRGWIGATMMSAVQNLMVLSTGLFMFGVVRNHVGVDDRMKCVVLAVLLAALPRFKFQYPRYMSEIVSAAVLVVLLFHLEVAVKRRQSMISLLVLLIVGRVFLYKSFFDNFALCMAYTASATALNASAASWYYSSNFFVWAYFLLALLLLYVYMRLWGRIWEHVRLLVVLSAKSRVVRNIGQSTVAAHLPADILHHIFPEDTKDDASCPVLSGECFLRPACAGGSVPDVSEGTFGQPGYGRTTPAGAKQSHASTPGAPDESAPRKQLLEAAVESGLLCNSSHGPVPLTQLRLLSGLDRRDCALIAIGLDDGSAGEDPCGVHGAQDLQSLHELLDRLAVEHRITCVRKFGNVWIGCVGFFRTWESQYINCYEAVLFAAEASFLGNGARMTFAVDCGTITGGFLRSLSFDFFGQEMRWLLMVVELRLHGKVVVGEAVQKLLNIHRRSSPSQLCFQVGPKKTTVPWRTGSDITVQVVLNAVDMVDFDVLSRFVDAEYCHPILKGEDFSERVKQLVPNVEDARSNTSQRRDTEMSWSHMSTLYSGSASAQYSMGAARNRTWEVSHSAPSFDQDIGEEFLLSASQRFQVSLSDAALDGFTDEELYAAHERMEARLYALIRRVCYPTLLRFVFLSSAYADDEGQAEHASVMDNTQHWLFEAFAEPLEAIVGRRSIHKLRTLWNRWSWRTEKNRSSKVTAGLRAKPQPTPQSSVRWPTKHKYALHRVTTIPENLQVDADEQSPAPPAGADYSLDMSLQDSAPAPLTALRRKPRSVATLATATSVSAMSDAPLTAREHRGAHYRIAAPKECKRGWLKYAADARMFFLNNTANGATALLFYLVMIFSVRHTLFVPHSAGYASAFLCSMVMHLALLLLLERRYDATFSYVISGLNILAFLAVGADYVCYTEMTNVGSVALPEIGDLGGETVMAMLTIVLVPFHMRQHAVFSFLDSVVLMLASILYRAVTGTHCSDQMTYISARSSTLFTLLLLSFYYWALQFATYASYMLEHKILPAALRNYRKQRDNSRALLKAFAPDVPVNKTCELYVQKPFRQAAVAALHVKVADQIAHFVDPADLELILDRIHKVVSKSVSECGMLPVTHFSGVYLAVACRDSAWDSVESLRFPDSHTARTVVFLRTVRHRLAALSREFKFNIHVGIGLNQGVAQLGFLGRSRFNYDMSGWARDLAVTMASFHNDGVFVCDAFDADIRKMQGPEDLIREVTEVLSPRRRLESKWLRIDGSFNGIQLEDFKYLCMLGQGGYGSVHLLAERHTGVPYAIKAIELKQESKLSKMIERECSILQMVSHPNVVSLKYSFRSHNRLYLVMSYIRGGNLKQVVERDKPGLAHMVAWFAELVLAVEHLHSLGIIHRDVKPANCMIGRLPRSFRCVLSI
jgi:hypothetical protein